MILSIVLNKVTIQQKHRLYWTWQDPKVVGLSVCNESSCWFDQGQCFPLRLNLSSKWDSSLILLNNQRITHFSFSLSENCTVSNLRYFTDRYLLKTYHIPDQMPIMMHIVIVHISLELFIYWCHSYSQTCLPKKGSLDICLQSLLSIWTMKIRLNKGGFADSGSDGHEILELLERGQGQSLPRSISPLLDTQRRTGVLSQTSSRASLANAVWPLFFWLEKFWSNFVLWVHKYCDYGWTMAQSLWQI